MIKQATRLNFWFHKSRSRLSLFLKEHLPHHQEKADEVMLEFEDTDCSEELQELSRTLVEEYEEYINSEPVLVPQTTILFAGQDHGRRCNFLGKRSPSGCEAEALDAGRGGRAAAYYREG